MGRIGSDVLGGYSNSGNVTENTVEVTGSVRVNSGVYGGQSISGTASGNTVRIGSGATVTGSIYGGENTYGAATGNTVIIDNGVVNSTIMGGRSSDENVTDNTIIIDNAIVKGNVFGGNTNSGIATGNTVIVKGNSDISQTDLTGGYGRISSAQHPAILVSWSERPKYRSLPEPAVHTAGDHRGWRYPVDPDQWGSDKYQRQQNQCGDGGGRKNAQCRQYGHPAEKRCRY